MTFYTKKGIHCSCYGSHPPSITWWNCMCNNGSEDKKRYVHKLRWWSSPNNVKALLPLATNLKEQTRRHRRKQHNERRPSVQEREDRLKSLLLAYNPSSKMEFLRSIGHRYWKVLSFVFSNLLYVWDIIISKLLTHLLF